MSWRQAEQVRGARGPGGAPRDVDYEPRHTIPQEPGRETLTPPLLPFLFPTVRVPSGLVA